MNPLAPHLPDLVVELRNVYGNDLLYPVSPQAHLFASIAGSKTLTPSILRMAKDAGFAIVEKYGRPINV